MRRVERSKLAVTIDHDLRAACRAEAAARREIGSLACALLRRRVYQRLGYARVGDYARERFGISARTLESAAAVARCLETLPMVAAALARGELSWTQARLLCRVAGPEN